MECGMECGIRNVEWEWGMRNVEWGMGNLKLGMTVTAG